MDQRRRHAHARQGVALAAPPRADASRHRADVAKDAGRVRAGLTPDGLGGVREAVSWLSQPRLLDHMMLDRECTAEEVAGNIHALAGAHQQIRFDGQAVSLPTVRRPLLGMVACTSLMP